MRYENLFVSGVGGWLPPAIDVAEAVADGRYPADIAAANDYVSITIADDEAPPEMAVRAGRLALERAGIGADQIALLLHSSSWYQGADFWPPASYIHRELLGDAGRRTPALDVQQMSNGVVALELAASFLAGGSERPAALITCADRFLPPGFDRWRADNRNIVWGDGASAVVVSRTGGFARLLAAGTVSDTAVEGLNRAGLSFGAQPGHAGFPVDLPARRRAYKDSGGFEGKSGLSERGLADAIELTLVDAGVKLSDVSRVVFPNMTLPTTQNFYLAPLGLELSVTTREMGRKVGHIGTADQYLGLAFLAESGQLRIGDRVLLVGIGVGMSWSCALVEIESVPAW
jgi:3-oxoacyl-[acyl-carrier-protein] synthase-3